MRKVLTVSLVLNNNGVVVGLQRTAGAIGGVATASDKAAGAMRRMASSTVAVSSAAARMGAILGGIVGAGTLALLGRDVYQYSQDLEGTTIAIAGLLNANREYVGSQDQWAASLADSRDLIKQIGVESLKTKATIPQLGDAFATTFGAVTAAGLQATNSEILKLTTRLTQVGNAFRVPMEQMRQEINSFITGQITEDSVIAKRLGFDNKSVKKLHADSKQFLEEINKRTEAYAKAAEAQSNTLSGKLMNTKEVIIATIARGLEPLSGKVIAVLDKTFGWFLQNGDRVVGFIRNTIQVIEHVVGSVVAWARANEELIKGIASTAVIVGSIAGSIALVSGAIALLASPVTQAVIGIVALGYAWQKLSELPEITIKGVPIVPYIRATFVGVVAIMQVSIGTQLRLLYALGETIGQAVGIIVAAVTAVRSVTSVLASMMVLGVKVFAAPFVWLGNLIFGTVRTIISLFAAVPRALAGPTAAVGGVMGILRRTFGTLIDAAAGPVRAVVGVFRRLAGAILDPFIAIVKKVVEILGKIPGEIIKRIPGATQALQDVIALGKAFANFSPVDNFSRAMKPGLDDMLAGIKDVREALNGPTSIPGPTEVLGDAWGKAKDFLAGMLPELKGVGEEAMEALFPSIAKAGAAKVDEKAGKAAAAAAKKLNDLRADYLNFMNDFRNEAKAGGDPLKEALAKITSDRQDAVQKLTELQEKLKAALGVRFDAKQASVDMTIVEQVFDMRKVDAYAKSLEDLNRDTLASSKARFELETDYALEALRRQNESRISMMDDAGDRELATRLATIDEWFAAEEAKILSTVKVHVERDKMLEALDKEREAREKHVTEELVRQQRQQLVGTQEWARRMAAAIGNVPDQVTRAIGESKLQLTTFFEDVLGGLVDHETSFGESVSNIIGGLAQKWSQLLSDMLSKTVLTGQSIVTQLKQVWQSLKGAGNPLDAALGGAGVGAFVGSVFGRPNNYGAEGGTIGGIVGGIAGYFLGNPALGAAIGSAIGAALGSMIQKGQDHIKVAINNGVATITSEKGISGEARADLAVQIQRRVKETGKAWQSILDLFPQHVRDVLATMTIPKINLTGGIESADITDQGALNALSDFLTNQLSAAGFDSIDHVLRKALSSMGVQNLKIHDIFTYWGTLQGKELQDAVRNYVVTLVEGVDLRDKLRAEPQSKLDEARRLANMGSLGRMDEVRAQMATIVASAAKLTDIEDIVAAQGEVNRLARTYYDMGIARLQRIDAIEQTMLSANAQLKEQIQLAGMDQQGKMDYFYERLGHLRTQLFRTTDEEQIAKLTQEMQGYISQALGLDPGNAENREKLLAIIEDMGAIGQSQLQKARDDQAAKDAKVLELQQKQLDALMGIQANTTPQPTVPPVIVTPRPWPIEKRPVRDPADPHPGHGLPWGNAAGGVSGGGGDFGATLREAIIAARDVATVRAGGAAAGAAGDDARRAQVRSAFDATTLSRSIAVEVRAALEGATFRTEEAIHVDNGDLGRNLEQRLTRNFVLVLRNNRDLAVPR